MTRGLQYTSTIIFFISFNPTHFYFFATPGSLGDLGSEAGGRVKLLQWELQVQTTGLTENLRPQGIFIGVKSHGGPHLSTKIQLYQTAYKL